jgi:hypothetical protein
MSKEQVKANAAAAAEAAKEIVEAVVEVNTQETAVAVMEKDEQGNEIAVHQPSTESVVALFMAGANKSNFLSSIIPDGSSAVTAKIYNAMNDNDGSIADLADEGQIITVTDFMAYPCVFEDQHGDMQEGIRCVLVTEDGKSFAAMANGVFSSLQKIVGVAGMAPWTPGINLAPVRKKTRKGFYTLTLRMQA